MNTDIERITTHLDVLNVAVHALIATTGTAKTVRLLDKKLQQYEAKLLASSASDDDLRLLGSLHRSLLGVVVQGGRDATSPPP